MTMATAVRSNLRAWSPQCNSRPRWALEQFAGVSVDPWDLSQRQLLP
ncbi:unnamed protein product [Chondrus crispus]|uniref:Uncharacterized protein n=1 Tax=Chondrus crispus TaxID=2769 RepID=R7QK38_CHOCR|nr:unnamed protein product [Chondrus crispus]CDF37841.1 unnamed protein product [Chondrus crispus]|eukprot:XP_005717712.1 unnamed protein product [Chondrus crispus]